MIKIGFDFSKIDVTAELLLGIIVVLLAIPMAIICRIIILKAVDKVKKRWFE